MWFEIIIIILHPTKTVNIMKKQFLFLAGAAIILASCGSGENKEADAAKEQAKMDSVVKARDAENAAKNDSALKAAENLKAMEKMKADSIAAAEAKAKEEAEAKSHKGGGHKTTKAPAQTPKPTPAVAPPVKSAQDQKFDNRAQPTSAKPTQTAEQQKAQDDKFNRRSGK